LTQLFPPNERFPADERCIQGLVAPDEVKDPLHERVTSQVPQFPQGHCAAQMRITIGVASWAV
jgi:hypothetical protein